jgi:hypothetical protein
MSIFPLCAATAGAAMILGPVVAAIVYSTIARPRARTGSWIASWPGFFAGAGLMLAVLCAKPFFHGEPAGDVAWHGLPLVEKAVGVGLFAALAEEIVRFSLGLALFRRVRTGPPIALAVMFALGWGGLESLVLGIQLLVHAGELLQSLDPSRIALPALPLLQVVERASAIVFHIAVCIFVVGASRSRPGRALGTFAAATIAHATIDAVVYWYKVPIEHALAAGDFPRVIGGSLEMEGIFLAAASMMLMAARRAVSSRPGEAASPGS